METTGQAETDWALEVGQGEAEFVSVEDGTHVMKVHGPQGGTHLYVAARLEGAHLRDEIEKYAYVEVEVTSPTALVSRTVNMRDVTSKDESTVELSSLYAYLDENVHGDITVTVKPYPPPSAGMIGGGGTRPKDRDD